MLLVFPGLSVKVTILGEGDLEKVDDLGRSYRNTIGFLTRETILEYLRRNRVFGALDSEQKLVGFLLFADYPDRFRIAQLCVDDAFQRQGVAKKLIEALKGSANQQKVIKLRCRRDFPAHAIWPKLGFVPLGDRVGRSSQGHLLTLWCCQLRTDDELGLWKAEESEEVLDAVIDSQILYDFGEEDSTKAQISRGLKNDFLVDSLRLWVTDEVFFEINRKDCPDQRKRSIELAHGFPRVEHDNELLVQFEAKLKNILPSEKPSQRSDVLQIAKTAASDVRIFVTRDEALLKKADQVAEVSGVKLMHPVHLITRLHEETEQQSYSPSRVSGLNLVWSRFGKDDFSGLSYSVFQTQGETKGRFLELLRSYLSHPYKYFCEILKSQGQPVALRIVELSTCKKLTVSMARVAPGVDVALFGQFLIADSLAKAITEGREAVVFDKEKLTPNLSPMLLKMGFLEDGNSFLRFVMPRVCSRHHVMKVISGLAPSMAYRYDTMDDTDLERHCAPLLMQSDVPCFLVPIRPAFAMGLIDRSLSEIDLFGGDPSVLLRWENVYYRKKSHHKMLTSPGRILWYVSGQEGGVVAVSHLDSVELGVPKVLFSQYQKFGILEWRDIFEICGRNVDHEIMAMKFSRTFMFQRKVLLSDLRRIYQMDSMKECLQSPALIPFGVFSRILEFGYPSSA